MTRPFGAHDAWRLRRLQGEGSSLAIEEDVLCGLSPLRQSASALLVPGKTGILTFLLERSDGVAGFVQVRRHVDPTAAELIFIAPAAEAHDGAVLVWPRLVADSSQLLGAEGVHRVYVALDEDDQVALTVFGRLGFKVFCSELVFRNGMHGPQAAKGRGRARTDGTDRAPGAAWAEIDGEVRPERPVDALAIAGLRLAEQTATARSDEPDDAPSQHPWGTYPLGGQIAGDGGYVWYDRRGELLAGWRVVAGRHGSWLRLFYRHDAEVAKAALKMAMDAAGPATAERPLFATVRGHEPVMHLALREAGFTPAERRFRLVKHLTRRIIEPAWQPAPALAEAAPAVTTMGAVRTTGLATGGNGRYEQP